MRAWSIHGDLSDLRKGRRSSPNARMEEGINNPKQDVEAGHTFRAAEFPNTPSAKTPITVSSCTMKTATLIISLVASAFAAPVAIDNPKTIAILERLNAPEPWEKRQHMIDPPYDELAGEKRQHMIDPPYDELAGQKRQHMIDPPYDELAGEKRQHMIDPPYDELAGEKRQHMIDPPYEELGDAWTPFKEDPHLRR